MARALRRLVRKGATDLDEELEVDIVGLERRALGLLVTTAGDEVDTLRMTRDAAVVLATSCRVPKTTRKTGLPWRRRRRAGGGGC
jgi:hypothetical protein